MKKLIIIVFILFSPFLSVAQAAEFITKDTVYIPKEQTIEGSLFAAGDTVRIEGTVNGDVFCAAKEVDITGKITGDVLCAGQIVTLVGPIAGNARIAGQTVAIQSTIEKNVTGVSQTFTLDSEAKIGGDLTMAAQKIRVLGTVGRDVIGGGETITLNGRVGRDSTFGVESLVIGQMASIGGNLSYTSNTKADVPPGTVFGNVSQQTPEQIKASISPVRSEQKPRNVKGVGFLIVSLVFGALLLLFLKNQTKHVLSSMTEVYLSTFVRGVLVFICIPIIIMLLIVTIIGIPFALVFGLILIPLYFIGRILASMVVGRFILTRLYEKQKDSLSWSLIVGVVIVWAIQSIPVIGEISSFFLTLFGFGGLTYILPSKQKTKQ